MHRHFLKNFTLFVEAIGYAGVIDELQLPNLTLKTEEHRAGGMDAPVEIDMGMEKLEAVATLSALDPEAQALFGAGDTGLTARGNLSSHGGAETAVEVIMRGMIKAQEIGAWKPGEKSQLKITAALTYYRYTQAGRVIHEIDIPNMVRVIDGVDQLATARRNLGL